MLKAARALIGYVQRQSSRKNQPPEVVGEAGQGELAARETNRLIEEKPLAPASSVTEAETELLYANRNSGRLK